MVRPYRQEKSRSAFERRLARFSASLARPEIEGAVHYLIDLLDELDLKTTEREPEIDGCEALDDIGTKIAIMGDGAPGDPTDAEPELDWCEANDYLTPAEVALLHDGFRPDTTAQLDHQTLSDIIGPLLTPPPPTSSAIADRRLFAKSRWFTLKITHRIVFRAGFLRLPKS